MSDRKPALGFIMLTVFLETLGFGLLIPIGPKLVQQLLGAGATEAEALPIFGRLMTTFFIMTFLFGPLMGALSDQFGRRSILLISMFGSGIDYFGQAFAPTLGVLYLTRAINGLSGATITVAFAYVADVSSPKNRAAAMGMVFAAFGVGFIMGPVAGGLLGATDIRLPFIVAGVLSLLNWLYGAFVLPESLAPEHRSKVTLAKCNPFGALGRLTAYPLVFRLAIASFMMNLAEFGLHGVWAGTSSERFGWGPFEVGMSLFAVGICAVVVQGGLTRTLIPRLGEIRSLILGIALGIAAFVGYGLATQGWMIYIVIVLCSPGGIAAPAAQAIITKSVRPDEQGAVQGALQSVKSLSGIFGPLISTSLAGYFISDSAPVRIPGAPFFACAIMMAAGLGLVLWAVRSRHREPQKAAA